MAFFMEKRTLFIAIFATIVQYYDYAIFGLTAGKLSIHFMPGFDESAKILNFFIFFALSVLAKPLAALIFGHIGDKYGRTVSLKIATAGIAFPTFIIGFLPTYESIGYVATILLVFCRILVVMFVAGEIDGARIYISEKFSHHKFLAGGLVSASCQTGVLLASLVNFMSSWDLFSFIAWRMNFIIGGILGLAVILMRNFFEESAVFINHKKTDEYRTMQDLSFYALFRSNLSVIFYVAIIMGSIGGIYQFHFIFSGVYFHKLTSLVSDRNLKFLITIAIMSYIFIAVIAGYVCDKYSPHKIVYSAIIINILLALIHFYHLSLNKFNAPLFIVMSGMIAFYNATLPIYLKKMLRISVRYRIFSLGHAMGSALLSASAPMICTFLHRWTQLNHIPMTYFIFLHLLLLLALFRVSRKCITHS